ncbi:hypothetical protein Dimus_006056, partial [Dionaea muscipula]
MARVRGQGDGGLLDPEQDLWVKQVPGKVGIVSGGGSRELDRQLGARPFMRVGSSSVAEEDQFDHGRGSGGVDPLDGRTSRFVSLSDLEEDLSEVGLSPLGGSDLDGRRTIFQGVAALRVEADPNGVVRDSSSRGKSRGWGGRRGRGGSR